MPTYTMKAPNGKTYNIEGPAGASEADVRAEIMRRDPGAGNAPQAPKPTGIKALLDAGTVAVPERAKASEGKTVGGALKNAFIDTNELVEGLYHAPGGLLKAAQHPVQTAKAIGGVAAQASDIATGGSQRLMDKFNVPESMRGPRTSTEAFDKLAQGAGDKYGSVAKALNTTYEAPLMPAITAASIAYPVARAAGVDRMVAGAAGAVGRAGGRTVAPVGQMVTAGGRYKRANAAMKAQAKGDFTAARVALRAERQAAEDRAATLVDTAGRTSNLADKRRGFRDTLARREARAIRDSEIRPTNLVTPEHLTELGEPVKRAAIAERDRIVNTMKAEDKKYRAAMDKAAADQAASGVGITHAGSSGERLLQQSQARLTHDPVNGPSVGTVGEATPSAKLHQGLVDALTGDRVPLTEDQAYRLSLLGRGSEVLGEGENLYRVVQPGIEAADGYRRFLGDIIKKPPEGFAGMKTQEAKDLYKSLTQVIDDYTGGAFKPVQNNWSAAKGELDKFEKSSMGKALTGEQKGTSIESVPAAQIPGRLVAAGRGSVQQASAIAGRHPVENAVRGVVQNELSAADTSAAIRGKVGHGTMLGDAIQGDTPLVNAVANRLNAVESAEGAAAEARMLRPRVAEQTAHGERLDRIANTLRGDAAKASEEALKAKKVAKGYKRDLNKLGAAKPEEVGPMYRAMIDDAHASGRITDAQHKAGLKLADEGAAAFKDLKKRNKWIKVAGITAGMMAVPKAGYFILRAGR